MKSSWRSGSASASRNSPADSALENFLEEGNREAALGHERSLVERVECGAQRVHVARQALEQEFRAVRRQLEPAQGSPPLKRGRQFLVIERSRVKDGGSRES